MPPFVAIYKCNTFSSITESINADEIIKYWTMLYSVDCADQTLAGLAFMFESNKTKG